MNLVIHIFFNLKIYPERRDLTVLRCLHEKKLTIAFDYTL